VRARPILFHARSHGNENPWNYSPSKKNASSTRIGCHVHHAFRPDAVDGLQHIPAQAGILLPVPCRSPLLRHVHLPPRSPPLARSLCSTIRGILKSPVPARTAVREPVLGTWSSIDRLSLPAESPKRVCPPGASGSFVRHISKLFITPQAPLEHPPQHSRSSWVYHKLITALPAPVGTPDWERRPSE